MGYVGDTLEGLAAPLDRGVERFGRKAVHEVGEDLHKRVTRHTPVAKESAADFFSYPTGGWRKARGRAPGTLKGSWRQGAVVVGVAGEAGRFRVPVYTLDPIAPHVEWPTMPHLIFPRKPGGVLTIPTVHGMVFAKMVLHPGTQGSYMMATALQEVAATWRTEVARAWAAEALVLWRGGAS